MQNTILVGLSRQVALGRELDAIANNIANVNTTGYKSAGASFEEFVGKTARSGNLSNRDSKVSFVRDRATWMDLSQGTIEPTGNPTDLAIDGKGFMVVQTENGNRYTRNGALRISPQGLLVTSDGNPVIGGTGPIKFQPKDRNIRVSPDGTISVQSGDETQTEALRGKLRLVKFDNMGALKKEGGSNFSVPDDVEVLADTSSRFVQGAVEKSNVRAIIEMTRMIDVTRTYTQVSAILSQQSDLNRSAIDKLAEVPN